MEDQILHRDQAPSPEDIRDLAQRAILELIGGQDVWDMLRLYHAERHSYRQIAELFNMDHVTVQRTMRRARVILRRLGVLPPAWEQSDGRKIAGDGCGTLRESASNS